MREGRKANIDSTPLFRTCLPDTQTGVVQTGIRNFAFTRDGSGKMWAGVPGDDNLTFKVFTSTDIATSWQFDSTIAIGNNGAYSFFPTIAVDALGRVGFSFQALGTTLAGGLGVTTWFAARPLGSTTFVGPVPISSPYVADNEPPQGVCFHPLCTANDIPLVQGCDPTGCVSAVCNVPGFAYCCDQLFGGWDRNCANVIGNQACSGFSCGGRALGDFAGQTSIVVASLAGLGDTFMPAWTQASASGGSFNSSVASALVQVTP